MPQQDTIFMAKTSILLILQLSFPAIAVATAVGLLIAIIQAVVQVQEQTLSFAVKLTAVIITFFATSSWTGALLLGFQNQVFDNFGALTR